MKITIDRHGELWIGYIEYSGVKIYAAMGSIATVIDKISTRMSTLTIFGE